MATPVVAVSSSPAVTSSGLVDDHHAPSPEMDAVRALLGARDDQATIVSSMEESIPRGRPRSDSAGLDALAAMAEQASANTSPSADDNNLVISASSSDDETPFSRRRSMSNPEGMEKLDHQHNNRFVLLPKDLLESELEEAKVAIHQHERHIESIPEGEVDEEQNDDDMDCKENEEDEHDLSPEELLQRARSRLLEDVSECNVKGDQKEGDLLLPHTLEKYKEVYNKNGRIGIYTPTERAAIISKFKDKRTRRVWNKKIRYNCRKSLADRRLRVKGRFVKREEQEQLLAARRAAEEKVNADAEKSDTSNPEDAFDPTEDQPFRRTRRYTIT